MVERLVEGQGVEGSIPSRGTIFFSVLMAESVDATGLKPVAFGHSGSTPDWDTMFFS